ncbi:HepT-like ribonuclease domain-containing protein [uncultured Algoriphagus sp.]|uniref:HepT-like ribonuclease domain-containing protein n=1 Tax=uncultured Algoriphagus sp. TaxID=417365 RepID=UPI0030EB56EB|tara:strand:+ start:1861 stop:2205 length:345 start_codon:yes stop_codon:yes gene_type:complete
MDERIEKWLYDIHFSIQEIESYFPAEEKNFFDYRKNSMRKRAVERHLEIIGEAFNRILKRDPSFEDKIKTARSIVGLRNQVIHAYDNISDENIWSILINHLPKLKADIKELLAV